MESYTTPFSRQDDLEQNSARRYRSQAVPARSDAAIEEEIWHAICKDRSLGTKYQENIAVEVEDGRVRLRGHVSKTWHSPLIANIARSVEGATLVKNGLVADEHLREQIVKALLQDERTAPYVFVVRCSFGWVQLGGLVPSQEIARMAETVAGFVPAVRGILALPSVFGALWLADAEFPPVRRALQPRPAASVVQDGAGPAAAAVGLVTQIILDPCSRLVSAIAVRPSASQAGAPAAERLVPMTAVEAANERQVWLKEGQALDQHPLFDRCQYPLPPTGWQPPFPYTPGTLRWSL